MLALERDEPVKMMHMIDTIKLIFDFIETYKQTSLLTLERKNQIIEILRRFGLYDLSGK